MTQMGEPGRPGERPTPPRCGWGRRVLPERTGPGRPAKFCSHKCRQWNWVAQQRAHELALNENELVVARSELDRLHDDLYVLACAVDDTERDLESAGPGASAAELRTMMTWLLEACRPLRDREISAADASPE